MAKKKQKLKNRRHQKFLDRAIPYAAMLFCVGIGVLISHVIPGKAANQSPKNIVWAADSSVKVPISLQKYLIDRNDCDHYRGANTPKGVGLWGVYQVSNDEFAKIAYGCSWNLSSYIMAVKQGQKWSLIPPSEYFAGFKDAPGTNGAIPNCTQLEKYKINKSIEAFCILPDGTAKVNEQI